MKISQQTKDALVEATKEFARVIVLALVPIFIVQIEAGSFDWRVLAFTGAIAGLRWVDKFLHTKAPEGKSGGLTRF
jgi:hypothetical protein